MNHRITRHDLLNLIGQEPGLILVEALPAPYFAKEHLPGAINLPLQEINEKAPVLMPDKDATVVIYCSNTSCNNSFIGSNLLRQMGYTKVYEYAGGKQDWREAGFDFERANQHA